MLVQKYFGGGIINVDTVNLSQVSLTFSKYFLFPDANMWSFHRDVFVKDGSTMWDMTRHSQSCMLVTVSPNNKMRAKV